MRICYLLNCPSGVGKLFTNVVAMAVKKLLNSSAAADLSKETIPSMIKLLLDFILAFLPKPSCLRDCQSLSGVVSVYIKIIVFHFNSGYHSSNFIP